MPGKKKPDYSNGRKREGVQGTPKKNTDRPIPPRKKGGRAPSEKKDAVVRLLPWWGRRKEGTALPTKIKKGKNLKLFGEEKGELSLLRVKKKRRARTTITNPGGKKGKRRKGLNCTWEEKTHHGVSFITLGGRRRKKKATQSRFDSWKKRKREKKGRRHVITFFFS